MEILGLHTLMDHNKHVSITSIVIGIIIFIVVAFLHSKYENSDENYVRNTCVKRIVSVCIFSAVFLVLSAFTNYTILDKFLIYLQTLGK